MLLSGNQKERGKKISDCSENILPTPLNYHDTAIFSCEVNFLNNCILFRSASIQKHPLGMASPRNGKKIIATAEFQGIKQDLLLSLLKVLDCIPMLSRPHKLSGFLYCNMSRESCSQQLSVTSSQLEGHPGRTQKAFWFFLYKFILTLTELKGNVITCMLSLLCCLNFYLAGCTRCGSQHWVSDVIFTVSTHLTHYVSTVLIKGEKASKQKTTTTTKMIIHNYIHIITFRNIKHILGKIK